MIRWTVRLAILLVLVVGLDRLAVGLVQGQLASRLQRSESLQDKPSVHIGGFPFLTQVFGGTYSDVQIHVKGLTRDKLEVSDLEVDAQGVKVALGDVVHGQVKEVPVDRGIVTATITFASVDAAFAAYGGKVVSVRTSSGGDGKVRLDGALNLPGGPYRVSGIAAVALVGGKLKVTPAPDLFSLVPAVVRSQAMSLLTPSIALPTLPFGITLDSATVRSDGVVLVASAKGIVLRTTAR